MLPAGRLIKLECEIVLPAAATREQIEEWVLASFGVGGVGSGSPLYNDEPELFAGKVDLTDTGYQARREEFDHKTLENGDRTYRVRYLREKSV